MTNPDHIKKRITIHERRLQVLEEQKAAMGVLTPPYIIIEIEDIKQTINELQTKLNDRKNGAETVSTANKEESIQDIPHAKPEMNPEKEIFISYAWGDESEKLVDRLDQAFQKKGISIIRDKRDAGFKAQIKEFMKRIGQGKAVIAIISKRYLESENCMFELVEIAKNGEFYDRIFPIVLKDANIYKPVERIQYIKYWENKIHELDEAMKSVSAANLQGFREVIDLYTEIRQTIARLTDVIADMNTLTPEIHLESDFEALFKSIEQKMAE